MDDKVDKIDAVGSKSKAGGVKVAEPEERVAPNKERFDSMLSPGSQENPAAVIDTKEQASPMDTMRQGGTEAKTQPTADDLLSRTQEAITRIEDIKHTLASPNITIKRSAQELLQNKLTHIDESLKIALSKAGVEFAPQELASPAPHAKVSPVERFLYFLTDGQWQLENLGKELRVMGATKEEMSPVNMLAIQVKMAQIQQELELFSNLLNKALESVKTIMNIQV